MDSYNPSHNWYEQTVSYEIAFSKAIYSQGSLLENKQSQLIRIYYITDFSFLRGEVIKGGKFPWNIMESSNAYIILKSIRSSLPGGSVQH